MQSNNKNVCRLCLRLVHDANAELINEVTRKMLDVLLIKLDLDVTEEPLMCRMCIDILDEIYMFKSKCLYSEDIISDHFDSDLKVNLRDILIKIGNKPDVSIAEDEAICRLCIKIPPNGSYVSLNKTDEELFFCGEVIQIHLLPEIDLSITEEPIICETCHILLKNYTSFVKNCEDVEQKIKLYYNHQGSNHKEPVDLDCVVHFIENKARYCGSNLDEEVIIKQECFISDKVEEFEDEEGNLSDDRYVDSSNAELYTRNEDANLKYKDDGMRVKSSESGESGDCDRSGESGFSKRKGQEVLEEHKCTLCTFISDASCSLEAHMKSHRGPTKAFGCPKCIYETDIRYHLVSHLIQHNKSDKNVYKCLLCPIEHKYRSAVLSHWKKNHDTNIQMYKCKECSFSTKYRSSFMRHQFTHNEKITKPPSSDRKRMYKCKLCSFEAKSSITIKCHMGKTHMDPSTPILKCDYCPYDTVIKNRLVLHMRRQHMIENVAVDYKSNLNEDFVIEQEDSVTVKVEQFEDVEDNVSNDEVKMTFGDEQMRAEASESDESGDCNSSGKSGSSKTKRQQIKSILEEHRCSLCSFIADTSCLMEAHMKSHRGATKKFGCPKCRYESNFKYYLVRHLFKHKDASHKGAYKCPQCPLRSIHKLVVLTHWKKQHDTYLQVCKCKDCSYSTKHMGAFLRHQQIHTETNGKYSCDKCTYSSTFKGNLSKHKNSHLDDNKRQIYKCKLCNFQAKSRLTIICHEARAHKDPSVPWLKCAHCPYQTVLKSLLKAHIRRWHLAGHNIQKPWTVPKEVILECDKCEFQTSDVSSLLDHMYRHDPSKQCMLKCSQCDYSTRDKLTLKKHKVTHRDTQSSRMLSCETLQEKS